LRNEEMLELKRIMADRRAARAEASMRMREADAS
jgi:hypothetical protein